MAARTWTPNTEVLGPVPADARDEQAGHRLILRSPRREGAQLAAELKAAAAERSAAKQHRSAYRSTLSHSDRPDSVGSVRVVFAGTPEAAVPTLEALVASRHDVVAVITRPDAPAGRGRTLTASPVALAAEAHGIEVLKPAKPSDPEFMARLASWSRDASRSWRTAP